MYTVEMVDVYSWLFVYNISVPFCPIQDAEVYNIICIASSKEWMSTVVSHRIKSYSGVYVIQRVRGTDVYFSVHDSSQMRTVVAPGCLASMTQTNKPQYFSSEVGSIPDIRWVIALLKRRQASVGATVGYPLCQCMDIPDHSFSLYLRADGYEGGVSVLFCLRSKRLFVRANFLTVKQTL